MTTAALELEGRAACGKNGCLMAGRECFHCKQWIEEGEAHDCWTTTESALTKDLAEDLRDAYERLREAALEFGDQRVYASHNSIMFSRKACYFFVRPKRSFLEVCVFLGRTVSAPQVRKSMASSKVKVAHLLQIRHRDEVEPPITEWLREAYALEDAPRPSSLAGSARRARSKPSVAGREAKKSARTTAKRGERPARRRR
jgi:hypothetical protein